VQQKDDISLAVARYKAAGGGGGKGDCRKAIWFAVVAFVFAATKAFASVPVIPVLFHCYAPEHAKPAGHSTPSGVADPVGQKYPGNATHGTLSALLPMQK
jgi:hypothetical protein